MTELHNKFKKQISEGNTILEKILTGCDLHSTPSGDLSEIHLRVFISRWNYNGSNGSSDSFTTPGCIEINLPVSIVKVP